LKELLKFSGAYYLKINFSRIKTIIKIIERNGKRTIAIKFEDLLGTPVQSLKAEFILRFISTIHSGAYLVDPSVFDITKLTLQQYNIPFIFEIQENNTTEEKPSTVVTIRDLNETCLIEFSYDKEVIKLIEEINNKKYIKSIPFALRSSYMIK
jgi:hypothetical protein